MSKVYKNFSKAVNVWSIRPNVDPKEGAYIAKNVFKNLIDVIENEQGFRASNKYPRTRFTKIAGLNDLQLEAHKGLALRAMYNAESILAHSEYLEPRQKQDERIAMLDRARDFIIERKGEFGDPDGQAAFVRFVAYYSRKVRNKVNSLFRKTPKPFTYAMAESTFLDLPTPSGLDGTQAVTLFPEQNFKCNKCNDTKKFQGESCPQCSFTWKCDSCRDDSQKWVRRERWGGEDYPCPKCNAIEYLEWLKIYHPDEVKDYKPGEA